MAAKAAEASLRRDRNRRGAWVRSGETATAHRNPPPPGKRYVVTADLLGRFLFRDARNVVCMHVRLSGLKKIYRWQLIARLVRHDRMSNLVGMDPQPPDDARELLESRGISLKTWIP
jgi:hypothetical protein